MPAARSRLIRLQGIPFPASATPSDSQRNERSVHLSFSARGRTAAGRPTLMLLTVYLLLARKGEKRQVFQTDTSAAVSQTRGSKLFYGKVSPIVTTTKKRPCHFATYGSGRARLLRSFPFLRSARTPLSHVCLLETMLPPLVGNGRPLPPSLARFKIPYNRLFRGHFRPRKRRGTVIAQSQPVSSRLKSLGSTLTRR